jgi:hypothetical protein
VFSVFCSSKQNTGVIKKLFTWIQMTYSCKKCSVAKPKFPSINQVSTFTNCSNELSNANIIIRSLDSGPVAHLSVGGGRKGQMHRMANFWERQNILTFIIDIFLIFLIFTPFSVLFSILKNIV